MVGHWVHGRCHFLWKIGRGESKIKLFNLLPANIYTWCSGHLVWHVGRYSVVVRYHMEDCHRWVYQNCWKMAREWTHRTMLHAPVKCTHDNQVHKAYACHAHSMLKLCAYLWSLLSTLSSATRSWCSSVGSVILIRDQSSLSCRIKLMVYSPQWLDTSTSQRLLPVLT